jgi:hypothetical protein
VPALESIVAAGRTLSPLLAHAGPVVAGVVFTAHMLAVKPADPLLWGVYMVSVGGCSALAEWIRGRQP